MHPFAQYQQHRDLVSIYRKDLDTHRIQGFVIASSAQLVVLQYVYDFNLDGLMVLRAADISEVEVSATDRFQKELLAQDGAVEKVPFDATFELLSWRTLISQLAGTNPLMTFECEASDPQDFVIGRVAGITASGVQVKHFSGTATWVNTPVELSYEDITCCQIGNSYANAYQRHFDRTSL